MRILIVPLWEALSLFVNPAANPPIQVWGAPTSTPRPVEHEPLSETGTVSTRNVIRNARPKCRQVEESTEPRAALHLGGSVVQEGEVRIRVIHEDRLHLHTDGQRRGVGINDG